MLLKKNEMLRCPKCGGTEFSASAHVVQDWIINSNGDCVSCRDDCVEILHEPDLDDMCDCEECGYSAAMREFVTNAAFHAAFLKKKTGYDGLTLDEINGLCKMLGDDKAFIPYEIGGCGTLAYGFIATDFYAENIDCIEDMTHHLEQVLSGTQDESEDGIYTYGPMRVFMGDAVPDEEKTVEEDAVENKTADEAGKTKAGRWLPIEKCIPLFDAAMRANLFDWTDGKLSLGDLEFQFVNGSIWKGLLKLPIHKKAYVIAYMCEHLGLKAKIYAYNIHWIPEFLDRERYPSSIEVPLNEVLNTGNYLSALTHGNFSQFTIGVKVEVDKRYHEIFKR